MLSALLIAQLAAASPPPARFELPNGLRVWVQEDRSRPVALVHVTYHVGSQNEGPGLTGIAHYVEHMVYRATENIRNEDVYGYIDRIGGRYTGGTWPDVTRYAETVPSWALESALRVTAERMTRSLFDSLEFERERSNVVTEAHGFADTDPASALRDAVMMAAFELHPYRYSSNTWARDNLKLTRAQAYAWYKEHYGPNNAVLVVVGDVKTNSVRAMVTKHFASLPRAPGSGRIAIAEPWQPGEKRIWMASPADSSRLDVLYRMPAATHPSFPALVRLDAALAPRLRAAIATAHPGVHVETHDTITAYPGVYRISAVGPRSTSMTAVLGTIDRTLLAFSNRSAEVMSDTTTAAPETRPTPRPVSTAAPPRGSNLTRIAESLAARELPAWEPTPEFRDSMVARSKRVSAVEYTGFTNTWLVPHRRTVGIFQAASGHGGMQSLAIPAMTTPPAKRLRPEPVPAEGLASLLPLAIDHAARTLANGVRVRGARVAGDRMWFRAVADYGGSADTLVRSFPASRADSALPAIVRELTALMQRRPAPAKDSSVEDRARARVLAAVRPPPVTYADGRPPLSVALAGPRPAAELVQLAARHLQGLPQRRAERLYEYFPTAGIRTEMIPVGGEKQVEIVAGLPGVHRRHQDRRALELLGYIVGVPYYGGRLGWALTKSGLTYSSAAQSFFDESGHILFGTTADVPNAPATIQAISEVIAGVGERGVEEWELREAQAFMIGRTVLYGAREDSHPATVAAALTDSDAAGLELLDLPALSRAYLSVTLDEINRVARRYYRPDMLKVVAMGATIGNEVASPFAPGTFSALFQP
jgi:predicted Zn-dependent peptidase